jgi:release factor glutamine methyltransferase
MVDMWLHLIRTIKPDSLLEIGSGAGYFAILAALNGVNRVTATDITQQAVDNTQANINKYDLTDRMTVKCGSVFEPLDENDRFDLIFWDFPFYSSTDKSVEELDALERTVCDPGYICVETYLKEAHKYLTDKGRLLIVFSHKLGDTNQLLKLINKYGWHLKLIEKPDQEIKLIQKTNDDDVDVNFYELIKQ